MGARPIARRSRAIPRGVALTAHVITWVCLVTTIVLVLIALRGNWSHANDGMVYLLFFIAVPVAASVGFVTAVFAVLGDHRPAWFPLVVDLAMLLLAVKVFFFS